MVTNEIIDIEVPEDANNEMGDKEMEKEEIEKDVVRIYETEKKEVEHGKMKKQDPEDHHQVPKMDSLHSCNKCDFVSEEIEDLRRHEEKNIHNIQDQNMMMIKELNTNVELEDDSSKCYLCDFVANKKDNLKKHAMNVHGIEKSPCSKCDYVAEDEDILGDHMKRHTDGILFSCYRCEFEATREYLLDNHNESKHMKKANPAEINCEYCEKTFMYCYAYEHHICKATSKFACQ